MRSLIARAESVHATAPGALLRVRVDAQPARCLSLLNCAHAAQRLTLTPPPCERVKCYRYISCESFSPFGMLPPQHLHGHVLYLPQLPCDASRSLVREEWRAHRHSDSSSGIGCCAQCRHSAPRMLLLQRHCRTTRLDPRPHTRSAVHCHAPWTSTDRQRSCSRTHGDPAAPPAAGARPR